MYTHPRKIVSVGGRGINFHCEGSGQPTVIFDAGFEDWSPAWAVVQPRISRLTRTCSYDRPGSGFSDPGLMPRTSMRIAKDLHDALHASGMAGPYVLVGHSFGSYNIRAYLDRYSEDIAGMVIVDGENGDVEPPKMSAEDNAELLSMLAPFRKCRAAIARGGPLPTRKSSNGKAVPCNRVFFRRMPDPVFSPALNALIERTSRTSIPLWDQIISELSEMPADAVYLRTHIHSLGNRPLRVLTAMRHFGDLSHASAKDRAEAAQFEAENAHAQAQWLKLSSNSKQWFAPKSGHYIEFEDPNLVVRAVEDVVRIVRAH